MSGIQRNIQDSSRGQILTYVWQRHGIRRGPGRPGELLEIAPIITVHECIYLRLELLRWKTVRQLMWMPLSWWYISFDAEYYSLRFFRKALKTRHKSVSFSAESLEWVSMHVAGFQLQCRCLLWCDETVAVYTWFLCMVGFDILSHSNKLRRFLSGRTLVSQDLNWQHWRRVTSYNIKVSLKQRKCMKLCSFVNENCEIQYM